MKQKILYILMIITALLGGNGDAWAQTTSYVLELNSEFSFSTGMFDFSGKAGQSHELSGPGKTVTFEAKKNGENYFYLQCSTDGKNWSDVGGEVDLGKDYKSFTRELPNTEIRYIRFFAKTNATLKKWYKNVKVTRATTLSMSSTNTLPLNIGEVKIGKTVSATVNVDFNNTTYNQTLTGSCTNSAFTVVPCLEMGEYGTASVTINFSPTTAGEHKGKVTLSMNGVQTHFEVKGTAQDKGTPAFTWNLSQAYINRNYKNFFSSTNTDLPYTITSNNSSIAQVVGDNLIVVGGTEGTVNFTVSQQGNDDWHPKTKTFSVKVSKPQNHLPLSITESNQAELVNNKAGSYTWEDGIKLGDGGDGFDWDDKIAQIDFQGIPDRISFNYERGNGTASGVEWRVEVSSNGSNWSEIWSSFDNSGSADIEILNKSSKSVRLIWSGNFGGYFKNIQITELRYLTTETTSLDFGENIQDELVAAQTFILKHCNAGYGVEIESSDPENFSISPSQLESTGGDKMGEERITVTYLNKNVGEHQGTITIGDPNGVNTPITINVTGSSLSNALELDPNQKPNYEVRKYKKVVLKRKLPKEKHFTLTIPFDYNISGIEGAYVAQLVFVTHNQFDSYTLYFKKLESGQMTANQPYIVWLPDEIPYLVCNDVEVVAPKAKSVNNDRTQGWTMQGNYEPGFSMDGLYGIAGGKFCLGTETETEGSYINAYTAYFTFLGTKNVRARVAVMDEGGNTTYIGELKDGVLQTEEGIYGLDGVQQNQLRKGINIVRQKDGSVRKILK